jgi:hypothetical protein
VKVELYGASDDLIEIRIDGKDRDEIGGYVPMRRDERCYRRALEVRSLGGARGLRAHAIYDGCWSFAAGQLEDGRSIPDGWSVRVEQEHPYSTRLVIDTGAELVEVTGEDGKPLHGGEGE